VEQISHLFIIFYLESNSFIRGKSPKYQIQDITLAYLSHTEECDDEMCPCLQEEIVSLFKPVIEKQGQSASSLTIEGVEELKKSQLMALI